MSGIPRDILGRLKKALLKCGQFDSNNDLRSIFVDSRISSWKDFSPQFHNKDSRVQAIIDTFVDKYNSNQENVLVLFLHVLSDQMHEDDACKKSLIQFVTGHAI